MIKFPKLKILFLLSTFYFLFSGSAFAAEVSFDTKTQEIKVNQLFEVGVFINSEEEDINAIEGRVVFPSNLLEVKEIRDGNSIINFWIERPKAKNGEIIFSGITPGGYNGGQGLILSIVFSAKKEGNGAIEFGGVKALRNDGQGTETDVKISNFQFLISKQIPISEIPMPEIKDNEPPEEFAPQIAADPAIFEGKWFLVFATQDKGSGIDNYEVCEGKRKCVTVESPYLLQNQNLDEEIIVKAVDKSGNERDATIPARFPRPWYKDYAILAILIIATIALVYLIRKILWKRKNTK
ncbi:hypothetical protein HZB93_03955 [Candidatus Falkowbacteria bacterium]|nr:hypothetical protein [Candidatus Falkowbacteria bacterium]